MIFPEILAPETETATLSAAPHPKDKAVRLSLTTNPPETITRKYLKQALCETFHKVFGFEICRMV